MTGWQPIETAPRDGTWIWGYIDSKWNGKKHTLKPPTQMALTWRECSEPEPHMSTRAASLVDLHGGYWSYHPKGKPAHGEPSHWMPLPPPPTDR